MPNDPLFNAIDVATLESVRRNVVWDNLFVDTPFQAKLRKAGVWDDFLGGSSMVENFRYGRAQGAAVPPGKTVTVTRQQTVSGFKIYPKAYVSWMPLDDWEMDDGSGTGGVINSGPDMIYDAYQELVENMTQTINTMVEMDNFRHGQPSGTGISTDRRYCINGLEEALGNGIDPSPFGNIFTSYGGQQRNGVIGSALNSTPLYLGNSNGYPGQIDFNALMQLWAQCTVTGGKPDLGITNVIGFAAIAVALDAQRRDVSNTRHDIRWDGLNFNGIDIYADPLAPSAKAADYIELAPANGVAGNNNLADGAGSSTQTQAFTTPQFTYNGSNVAVSPTGSNFPSNTTIQPAEVLYVLESASFKIRPTNKKGWRHGLRRAPMPNNVSMDAIFERLGLNLYCVRPRRCAVAVGFSS